MTAMYAIRGRNSQPSLLVADVLISHPDIHRQSEARIGIPVEAVKTLPLICEPNDTLARINAPSPAISHQALSFPAGLCLWMYHPRSIRSA